MRLLLAALGMALVLSVGLLVSSVAFIVALFFGFPVGWGIALSIYSLAFAHGGWNGLSRLGIGIRGVSNNAEGAFALWHAIAFGLCAALAFSALPYKVSAIWALVVFPLVFIAGPMIQWPLEELLNLINKSGKRAQQGG